MTERHIPAEYNDKSRQWIDRMTRRAVSLCGVGILLVMLVLFFWLLWEVVPLFIAPSVYSLSQGQLWQSAPAVAGGIDRNQRWSWRIARNGDARFLPLNAAPPTVSESLSPAVALAASAADGSVALIDNDGQLRLVRADFSQPQPRWASPLGTAPLLQNLTASRDASLVALPNQQWQIAVVERQGVQITRFSRGGVAETARLNAPDLQQVLQSPDGELIYTRSPRQLSVWQRGAQGYALRDSHALALPSSNMALLSGGGSLLLADASGISQWFDITADNGPRLEKIRPFRGASGSAMLITEAQRRVFATLSDDGLLQLFASKQRGALLSHQLLPGITAAWFAPGGNGLWVERQANWHYYRLDNPWPDVSWRNLWQKVWYEHYPAADYVWQSTAADDDFQGKYSLVPLIGGTLKAALLAMLFAVPLALAAAMYTAWFMSPGLRRWVKPGVEMMGALPTVVVGLIASIWLAPVLAARLSGILLLPLLIAAVLLLMHPLSRRVPGRFGRWLFAPGREIFLLLPLLIATLLIAVYAVPWLEHLIWPQGLLIRWDIDYQQRNLLVAAVAMGFALVPLIFTLAEDALFSVPLSLARGSLALGATPWQTLTRVILPGASAGIFAALMIGFGRAMGETMIVLMVTSNTPTTEGSLFQGLRTLAANVAIEMPEAAAGSAHYRILFLSALVLLIFTLVVNTVAEVLRQRLRSRFSQHEGQG